MAADARQHRAPVQDRRFVRGQPPIPRHLTRWLYSVVGANYARSVSRWRGKLRIASLRLLSPQNPLRWAFAGVFLVRITPPLPDKTASLGFARVSFRCKLRLLSRCKLLALGLRWVSFRRKLRSLSFPLARKTAYCFVAPSHSTKPADAGLLWGVFSAYRTSSPLQNRLRWVLQGFLRGNCSPPQRTRCPKGWTSRTFAG